MTEPASVGAPPSFAEGALIADKYRVEGVIGQGGMGVVLRARHIQLDRLVAIKVVKQELAQVEEIVARMLIEARAAAKIKSEHVARVLDVGRLDDGTPFIVMEYLEGRDLYDVIGECIQLDVAQSIDYVLQACEAMAEAHAAGIVHRDLKPENLFLHQLRDGTQIIKVLDFGISKSTGQGVSRRSQMALTSPHGVVGSVHYMAPEQMRARADVDTRADIYALGSIVFELLIGRPPFDANSVPEVCSKVLTDKPESVTALRPTVPAALDAVIQRCLEKEREARFQNVSELADALAPFGSEQAVRSAGRIARILLGKASRLTPSSTDSLGRIAIAVASTGAPPTTHPDVKTDPGPDARSKRLRRIVAAFAVAALAAVAIVYATSSRKAAPERDVQPPVATSVASVATTPGPAPSASSATLPEVTPATAAPPGTASAPPRGLAPDPQQKPRHWAPVAAPKPKPATDPYDTSAFGGRR